MTEPYTFQPDRASSPALYYWDGNTMHRLDIVRGIDDHSFWDFRTRQVIRALLVVAEQDLEAQEQNAQR